MTIQTIPSMGDKAKDVVTGFSGVVTGRSEYINGCVHLMLEAPAKNGAKSVHEWFDDSRCVRTSAGGALRVKLGLNQPPRRRRATVRPRKRKTGGPALHEPPRH